MKKAVDIKLLPYRRPVIAMEGTTALIDTGATIPMFYFPVELLAKAFNGVDLTRREQEIPHLYRWRDELR